VLVYNQFADEKSVVYCIRNVKTVGLFLSNEYLDRNKAIFSTLHTQLTVGFSSSSCQCNTILQCHDNFKIFLNLEITFLFCSYWSLFLKIFFVLVLNFVGYVCTSILLPGFWSTNLLSNFYPDHFVILYASAVFFHV
jgi:hypothetical protein